MTTAEQKARQDAATIVRGNLNLLDTAPSDWTYEQRTSYNKALSAYIQAHPVIFTAQDLESAKLVESRPYEPLETLGLEEAGGIFTDEFLEQGKSVLSSSGNTLKNSIYIAVSIAVVIYLLPIVIKAFKETKTTSA